jgi:hypothetical protein
MCVCTFVCKCVCPCVYVCFYLPAATLSEGKPVEGSLAGWRFPPQSTSEDGDPARMSDAFSQSAVLTKEAELPVPCIHVFLHWTLPYAYRRFSRLTCIIFIYIHAYIYIIML